MSSSNPPPSGLPPEPPVGPAALMNTIGLNGIVKHATKFREQSDIDELFIASDYLAEAGFEIGASALRQLAEAATMLGRPRHFEMSKYHEAMLHAQMIRMGIPSPILNDRDLNSNYAPPIRWEMDDRTGRRVYKATDKLPGDV